MLLVTLQVALENREQVEAIREKMFEMLANHACTIAVEGWERCRACSKEYAYPHLCHTHMLCGLCHPDLVVSGNEEHKK